MRDLTSSVQSAIIPVAASTQLIHVGCKMRIATAEDAESLVRKYLLGTRTSHGKISTLSAEEKTEGPDNQGTWRVKGTYLTEAGIRSRFSASVSSRGEVLITSSSSTKSKRQSGRSDVGRKLTSTEYAARRRRRKKQTPGKRTKPRRNIA
jgi:hypothetical protein